MTNSPRLILTGDNDTPIWGMTSAIRITRLFDKQQVESALAPDAAIWADTGYAFDPQWLRHVTANPGIVVTISGVPVLAHLRHADDAAALARGEIPADHAVIEFNSQPQIYNHELRKLDTPFLSILTPTTVKEIERKSYFGAYKGVTDILTKYLWPEFALVLTRIAAKLGMTPNMVTAIGAILCVAATYLFYAGYFWTGMLLGFIFMVLDTVDGKLARCTITSSYWGNVFDHGIDLVHPPFWWLAWAFGCATVGYPLGYHMFIFILIAIFGGYVAQRVIEGIFIWAFGIHIHVWRPIDSQFRLITARRNPNMVLLFAGLLIGRPDLGLIWVAYWTVISLGIHLLQMLQAAIVKAQGKPIISWLRAPA
ncbi:CDP-alcohol phosphatidyltransferase family protein [Aquisediminimonas sediminicola]|uniref:CDP-alcohol phosphatidyltransferase family protein n=1 Tax=Alteraquisediminimonas sediminicola TaxID=2676787 RepID=UPI001C8E6D6F|nr:CDP-alcohol phosphatidyltransferase family protein [Aquisediminimonas sediminicola]